MSDEMRELCRRILRDEETFAAIRNWECDAFEQILANLDAIEREWSAGSPPLMNTVYATRKRVEGLATLRGLGALTETATTARAKALEEAALIAERYLCADQAGLQIALQIRGAK